MFLIRIACVLSLLGLAACDRLPESYPPPEQRHPVVGISPASGSDAMMVAMDSSDADLLIAKDIYSGTGISWRWTKKEPTVRIPLLSTENLKFNCDFALWQDSFRITGPLEISFLVNGKLLDKVRYDTPGDKHFEKPVPDKWLTGNEATVALSVDKLYIA